MADKYVQLHPSTTESGITSLDENVNLYPYIGPDSFKYYNPEQASLGVFKAQAKLVAGVNIKNIAYSSKQAPKSILVTDSETVLNIPLLDLIYPVGSIYTSTNDPYDGECPIEHLLGGVWRRIKDTFLFAKGDSDSLSETLGEDITYTAGSKDAVCVSHTHDASWADNHTHSKGTMQITGEFPGIWAEEGSSTYYKGAFSVKTKNDGVYVNNGNASKDCIAKFETDDDCWTGETSAAGRHTHTIGTPSNGVSGVDKNMPPYRVVMAWYRVE